MTAMNGYEGRIGRYGPDLARALAQVAGVRRNEQVLDVGCGSGALTAELAAIAGNDHVCALDPDADAVAACRARVPGVDARVGRAESLPFADGEFDVTLAQLVVSLLDDAPLGVREMARVTRAGGRVATCVWDFAGGMTVLRAFWDAAGAVSPRLAREYDQANTRPYASENELDALWRSAGLDRVSTGELTAGAGYRDFADLWGPLEVPDGQPGRFLERLEPPARDAVRHELQGRLGAPERPFRLEARAWYVLGLAPSRTGFIPNRHP